MNTRKLRVDISKTVTILFTDYVSVTSEFVKRQGLPGKYLKLVRSPTSPWEWALTEAKGKGE